MAGFILNKKIPEKPSLGCPNLLSANQLVLPPARKRLALLPHLAKIVE
jgi:hypothetical protein